MTKEKKSFLERITGSRKLEDDSLRELSSMSVIDEDDEMELEMPTSRRSFSPKETYPEDDDNDGEGQLTLDVYQTPNEIVIKSTIAGVKPEDLEVSINNDLVTIKGERKSEEEIEEENYYYQECYWGSFSRSIVLPVDIIADKVEASLKNGILTIKLPKADVTTIKKIQVRGF